MRKLFLASAASMGTLLAAAGVANAQPVKPVAPGTIVVHVNGYLQFGLDAYGSTYNTYTAAGVTNKLNSVTTNGDARLYAGFDAATLNGINYGTQIELRTAKSDSGEGAQNNTGTGNASGLEGLYVKRAYGYLGTKEDGYVRLGQTDSAFTLLQTGVIEAFGDGSQFNGDGTIVTALPSKATPGQFIYADQSPLYATDKVVLISPALPETFLGGAFSGSVGFEPNSNGLKEGYGNNGTASTTSAALASSTTSVPKERKDTLDAAASYALKANGFATKTSVGVLYGAPVGYNGATAALHQDELQVLEAGAQTTYAGVTIGANIKGGQTLDGYAPKFVGTRNALTYIVGANYVVGPYVIGASFFDGQTAGAATEANAKTVGRTLSEYGASVGANYVVGKDLSLYVQYLYGHGHQHNGFTTVAGVANKASNFQVQAVGTGATFKW